MIHKLSSLARCLIDAPIKPKSKLYYAILHTSVICATPGVVTSDFFFLERTSNWRWKARRQPTVIRRHFTDRKELYRPKYHAVMAVLLPLYWAAPATVLLMLWPRGYSFMMHHLIRECDFIGIADHLMGIGAYAGGYHTHYVKLWRGGLAQDWVPATQQTVW